MDVIFFKGSNEPMLYNSKIKQNICLLLCASKGIKKDIYVITCLKEENIQKRESQAKRARG